MIKNYLPRLAENDITRLSHHFPAVAIVGPRQVGKTSLAQHLSHLWERPSVYLDLENPADFNKFSDPGLFLDPLQDRSRRSDC